VFEKGKKPRVSLTPEQKKANKLALKEKMEALKQKKED